MRSAFFSGTLLVSATGHKLGALGGHFFFFLLAHGAAQDVGFAERETGQAIGDLHHLFLVQDDAVSFFENFLELRQFVADFSFAVFAIDEVVDHATLDGARSVKSIEGGEIFNARRLIAAKNVAHAVRFKLENGGGVAAGEKFVSIGIV